MGDRIYSVTKPQLLRQLNETVYLPQKLLVYQVYQASIEAETIFIKNRFSTQRVVIKPWTRPMTADFVLTVTVNINNEFML